MTVVHRQPLPIEGVDGPTVDSPTVAAVRAAGLLAEPLTYEEFEQVCDLYDWSRVELEDGVVMAMPDETEAHSWTCTVVKHHLDEVFGWQLVNFTGTTRMTEDTAFKPDVWVVSAPPQPAVRKLTPIPEMVLMVEVTIHSHARDFGRKQEHYAAAGVPEYWVIEPDDGVLHRFTEPGREGYGVKTTFDVGRFAESIDVQAILTVAP